MLFESPERVRDMGSRNIDFQERIQSPTNDDLKVNKHQQTESSASPGSNY